MLPPLETAGVVIATDGHPFWVPELRDWVDAKNLKPDMWLRTAAGTYVQVTAIKKWTSYQRVHNLTVADIHTYHVAVGDTDVLVHNAGICSIDPKDVRFSQDSVSGAFKDGRTVDDMATDLKSGKLSSGDVPEIRLVERDGQLYTLDNRRLLAFQRAGVPVRYRMATAAEIRRDAFKFTTRNGGTSIRVRGQ